MRFGVIGCGFIVDWFLEAAGKVPGFTLAAVYSRDLARAQSYAQTWGAAHAFDDLAAFAQSDAFDAVYVASPNALHCPQTLQMLRAKKHVLCEKPAASNAAEFALMRRIAAENDCLLLEAMRPLFAPYFAGIQEALPSLGPLRRASFVFNQYSSRYDKFKNGVVENAFRPELSNGALMDIGVYCVAMMIGLFGPPKRVLSQSIRLANGLDGQGFILGVYDGMLAELSYSKISDSVVGSSIQGENGSLLFDHITKPKTMQLCLRGEEPRPVPLTDAENNMVYEIEQFIQNVENKCEAEWYLNCTAQSLAVMDEARRQQGIVFPADREQAGR